MRKIKIDLSEYARLLQIANIAEEICLHASSSKTKKKMLKTLSESLKFIGGACHACGKKINGGRSVNGNLYCHSREDYPFLTCYENAWIGKASE